MKEGVVNEMTEKFQEKIDEIMAAREELANELTTLMKMKEMHNVLNKCKDEGHVWTLTNVQSSILGVSHISLVCARCEGTVSAASPSGLMVEYERFDEEDIEQMTGAKY